MAEQLKVIWKDSRSYRVDPGVAWASLNEIKVKHGAITPDAVVREAEDASHPLHDCFEWDNSKAAHEWRKEQARNLIRSLKIVRIGREAPAFVSVKVEGGRVYQDIETVVQDKDALQSAMEDVRERLEEAQRAMRELEFAASGRNRRRAERAARHVRAAAEEIEAIAA